MALMAKRVRRPSDPTVAASLDGGQTVAAPLGGGQTTAMPNTRPTDKVELAWSTGNDYGNELGNDAADDFHEEEPQDADTSQSWSATLRIAGLLVVAGLVLSGAILLGRWLLAPASSPTNAAPSQAPTTLTSAEPASATTGPPAAISSTPDQDNKFLNTLKANGIPITNIDPVQIIAAGKVVCQHLAAGWTVPQTVDDFRQTNKENANLANRAADFEIGRAHV